MNQLAKKGLSAVAGALSLALVFSACSKSSTSSGLSSSSPAGGSVSSAFRPAGQADNDHRKNGVHVLSATYGGTTTPIYNGCPVIPAGNVTAKVFDACQGLKTCQYTVNVGVLGDPAPGCWKSFEATYECAEDANATRTVSVPGGGISLEANGHTVTLECPIK